MTDYTPSAGLTAALKTFDDAQAAAEEARINLRTAVANELKTHDITNEVIADHLPWSSETVRGIAREYGVPRKRKPTVKSIKPQKKTAGAKPST